MINKGQGKTDENEMVLGHMAIIPFPVLFAWHSVKKRVKTTKIKDNKIIKNLKVKLFSFFDWFSLKVVKRRVKQR